MCCEGSRGDKKIYGRLRKAPIHGDIDIAVGVATPMREREHAVPLQALCRNCLLPASCGA